MLSEPKIEEKEFIHEDQELLFHLLKNNISFPISMITKLGIVEKFLYNELQKQKKLDIFKGKKVEIREQIKIEEIIEEDNIERFRLISNDNNFSFNWRIKKVNKLFKYNEIPIILYCIEKNAIKCFKYALINGGDPSTRSLYFDSVCNRCRKKKWDGYGFAGAIGNIQIIKMIEDQKIPINRYLMKGCSKFHQNLLIQWIEKENKSQESNTSSFCSKL